MRKTWPLANARVLSQLMRQVVGADIGYAALHELVELLREDTAEAGLARGCVFYISMALWGPRRVPTLRVSYLAVLPAFLKVGESPQLGAFGGPNG